MAIVNFNFTSPPYGSTSFSEVVPISDGVNSTTATITADRTGNSGYFSYGYTNEADFSSNVFSAQAIVTIGFADPVHDFSFTIGDIDQGGWDDQVTVTAIDANGDPVTIDVSGTTHHTVTTSSTSVIVEGESDDSDETGPLGTGSDDVNFFIEGPLSQVTIVFEAGPDAIGAGYVDFGLFAADPAPICFSRGTLIETDRGAVLIEDLSDGDLGFTQDNGYQPIRWIGNRRLSRTQLETNPKLSPIRIQAGALGHGLPEQDLLVSPQHRVLLRNKIAMNMFEVPEVLVPANKLLVLPGIDIDENCDGVEYYHMLFKQHEIVFSNGSPTESLFTGPEALKAVSPEAREEIAALFPEILEPNFVPTPARFIPEKGKHMKILAKRLAKNSHHAPFEE
jgi:hypothetical protein